MSERKIELIRRYIAAFNARDVEAAIALCDPSIEYHSVFAGAVTGAVYHGHDGMRTFFGDLGEAWGDRLRVQPEAYFDLGECTLTFFVLRGRGQQSGAEVAMPGTGVSRWRDGLQTYVHVYTDRADALRDLGVSEEELERIAP